MATDPKSFYWYDLETTGLKASWDRIVQFAGQRTDINLEPIGDPLRLIVKIPPQVLPSPQATLVTGLTPARTQSEGIGEFDAINLILKEFSQPGTCVVGYNNISFDDEFIRHALFRNLLPPYEWAYKNNNSRFDLIRAVEAVVSIKPDALNWELDEEDAPHTSLASIAKANDIDASQAHDAIADVEMSIAIAGKIKEKEPKLWNYLIANRDKKDVKKIIEQDRPYLVATSRHFGRKRRFASVIGLFGPDKENANQYLAADLNSDLELFFTGTPEEVTEARFRSKAEAEETGKPRLNLFNLTINRCPFVVSVNKLPDEWIERLGIDQKLVDHNISSLAQLDSEVLQNKVKHVADGQAYEGEPRQDPSEQLYDGFVGNQDASYSKRIVDNINRGGKWLKVSFGDQRLTRLYRRLQYELNPEGFPELTEKHASYVRTSLERTDVGLPAKREELKDCREEEMTEEEARILEDLEAYYENIATEYGA